MKAKRPARIVLAGASVLALAACQEETTEASVFRNQGVCENAGVDPATCAAAFETAQAEHEETAPRYDAQAVCEEQHGAGNCVAEEQAGGGGSIFMPLMMGYLLGSALGGGLRSRPLVGGGQGGGFRTTDGRVATNGLNGRTSVRSGAFNATPASTRNAAPLTRSTVARSGGFGAARTGGGRVGGFGG